MLKRFFNTKRKYFKWIIAFFAMLFFSVGTLVAVVTTGYSATSIETGAAGLSGSYDGGTWSSNGSSITGSVTTSSSTSCGDTTYTSQSGTLTLTNSLSISGSASLSFSYSLSLNGGSATINGASVSSSSTFSDSSFTQNKTVTIKITSSGSAANTTTITISNIVFTPPEVDISTTFMPADANGTYTVSSSELATTTITSNFTHSQKSTIAYTLTATPASGYKLASWQYNGSALSSLNPASFNPSQDGGTIKPVFVASDSARFLVGTTYFYDFAEAINTAHSGSNKTVILAENGTIHGNFTIPSDVTFLVPYNSSNTIKTTMPDVGFVDHVNPSVYRKLIMASDAHIINNGAISVGGELCSKGQTKAWNGCTTGPCGFIQMAASSSITLSSTGKLYCWGFVYGSGTITAQSGSQTYEPFQIKDYRGGTCSNSMKSNTKGINNKGVFPFNQYYVQNIEVAITFEYGAKEFVVTSTNIARLESVSPTTVSFIGTSDCMFNLTSGSITKKLNTTNDILEVIVDGGNVSISPISVKIVVSISSTTIASSNFVLPITNNLNISIINSSSLSVGQDIAFFPGTKLSIDSTSSMSINGHYVILYDMTEWTNANGNNMVCPVGWTASNGTTSKRPSLQDAEFDVNGTITVGTSSNSCLYTTSSGANIHTSLGSGKITFGTISANGATSYYVPDTGPTYNEIPVVNAKLLNGDNSYTVSNTASSGNLFKYCTTCNKWHNSNAKYTVTFHINDGASSDTYVIQNVASHGTIAFPSAETCGFEYTGHAFDYWSANTFGTSGSYAPGVTSPHITGDTDYYAIWAEGTKYTITWLNYDNSLLDTSLVAEGVTPTYTGEEPTKPSTVQYDYTFSGWTPTLVPVTGDATYTATFNQSLREYTITWLNYDNSLLGRDQVAYGTVPVYTGATPTKEGDASHTYTFNGWDVEPVAVTGDATYKATFTEEEKYIISWLNYDGSTLATSSLSLGETPVYPGATPTRPADAQYTYTFSGWTPSIVPVTGTASYTATYSTTVNTYTITWKNYDGSILETDTNVPYGTTPTYDSATPTKPSDAQYSYSFSGWSPTVAAITGDTIYIAQFGNTTNTYTVTWKNYDGSVLETDTNVPYGTTPTYDSATPVKPESSDKYYVFSGWSPTVSAITGNTVYTATFIENDKIAITFSNEDGSYSSTQYFIPGTVINLPTTYGDGTYSLKKWKNGGSVYDPGASYTVNSETTFIAYYGGFISIGTDFYYVEYTSASFTPATGIYSIEGSLYSFDNDGKWQYSTTGMVTDASGIFYLESGIVTHYGAGLEKIDGKYYYFAEDGRALANGTYYISDNLNGLLPAGTYTFNADGSIATITTSDGTGNPTLVIVDGVQYCVIDGIKVGYGLFQYNGYYYYAMPDGTIVTSGTYYVSVTNGLYTAGLYYFDANGHMYSEAFTQLTYN